MYPEQFRRLATYPARDSLRPSALSAAHLSPVTQRLDLLILISRYLGKEGIAGGSSSSSSSPPKASHKTLDLIELVGGNDIAFLARLFQSKAIIESRNLAISWEFLNCSLRAGTIMNKLMIDFGELSAITWLLVIKWKRWSNIRWSGGPQNFGLVLYIMGDYIL